jgi:hypothetical protein
MVAMVVGCRVYAHALFAEPVGKLGCHRGWPVVAEQSRALIDSYETVNPLFCDGQHIRDCP